MRKKSEECILEEVRGRWRGDENKTWPREADRRGCCQRSWRTREEECKGIDRKVGERTRWEWGKNALGKLKLTEQSRKNIDFFAFFYWIFI